MMRALAAVWLVAATAPAGLSPDWVAAPALLKDETAHYSRTAAGGPPQTLVATTHLCQCQPGEAFDEVSSAVLATFPAAIVDRSTDVACGTTVQHLVVKGVADGATHANVDVYAYRTSDSLVTITLTFSTPSPSAADEASMRAVCPPVAASS